LNARGLAPLLLLLAGVAVVLFFRIGVPPVANPAEARVEGVVREMVHSGDWLVPRLHGEPRLQKPPGYYWLAAAISSAAGGTSWASLRAGSALAALAFVTVTFAWGRAIGGPALGITAALCLASMQFTLNFGRRGVAEMLLALATALALASFDRIRFESDRRWIPVFALALWLGILAKATAALLMIGVPIGVWLVFDPASRAPARALVPWALASIAAGFAWYVFVLATVPHAFATIISEATLPLGVKVDGANSALHYELPYFYIGPLVGGTLPAALLLPLTIWRCVKTRLHAASPRLRFAGLGFAALLAVLAVIPQKQRHYILPLLPMLALLMAEAVLELRERAPERLNRALLWGAALLTPAGIAALVALNCIYGDFFGAPQGPRLAMLAAGAALLGGLLWSARAGHPALFAGFGAAAVLTSMLVWFGSINIWQREFEAGTAMSRPDFEPERWASASEAHPRIARFLLADAARRH
jgi:4-amino-4-deoxy-L-arabinose transferase-like glycosyltransferase